MHGNKYTNIGRPTPNNTAYILDENQAPLPIGEVGELWAGGDGVTLGYLNNEELTHARYRDDPFCNDNRKMFITRDLGRWNSHGEIEHLGRTDDLIKVKRFRVELDSVSNHLNTIAQCSFSSTLFYKNQILISFIADSLVPINEIPRKLMNKLPYYSIPERIIEISHIPLTIRGKINRNELEQIYENTLADELEEMVG